MGCAYIRESSAVDPPPPKKTYRRVQVPRHVLGLDRQLPHDGRHGLCLVLAHSVEAAEDLAFPVGNDVPAEGGWGEEGEERGQGGECASWSRKEGAKFTYPSIPGFILMRSMVSSTCDFLVHGGIEKRGEA